MPIEIVSFQPHFAAAFNDLNRVWLDGFGLFEEEDRKYLEHPQEMILDHGGEIFFALLDGEVVGTCAAIPRGHQTVELAKLAVADRAKGQGLGKLLSETVLEWSRNQGAAKVVLVSSTKLQPALRLYEKMGFVHCPLPADVGYETADVYMEYRLREPTGNQPPG
ncbi:MAG: GNAT family N-acetyltransferase [Blastocatellia bacterium]|nr:GNAT family N-acetyltransferase [Blastocatellia bacterium]